MRSVLTVICPALWVFQLWLAFFLSLSGLLVRPGDNVTFICFSVLGGLAMGGYFATPEAMKPDVVDYDEFRTGARYAYTRIAPVHLLFIRVSIDFVNRTECFDISRSLARCCVLPTGAAIPISIFRQKHLI